MRTMLFLFACLAATPVLAQNATNRHPAGQKLPDLQEPPPQQPHAEQHKKGKSIEPKVTIVPGEGKEKVEEYSVNGRVYMIKVIPAKGYPYYLIDTTGNGVFDTRRSGPQPNIAIPNWVIFKW